MNLWENIITKIEDEPWDDYLIAGERHLKSACFVIIALAVIYFGGHLIFYWIRG